MFKFLRAILKQLTIAVSFVLFTAFENKENKNLTSYFAFATVDDDFLSKT